jgi:hypothetical protein
MSCMTPPHPFADVQLELNPNSTAKEVVHDESTNTPQSS